MGEKPGSDGAMMEKEIDIQQERIMKLVKLAQENPELRIIPMVESEAVLGDDYSFWVASWGEPRIDEVWNREERIYFRSTDEDELVDNEIDDFFKPDLPEEEAVAKGKEIVAAYEWETVIVVEIRSL